MQRTWAVCSFCACTVGGAIATTTVHPKIVCTQNICGSIEEAHPKQHLTSFASEQVAAVRIGADSQRSGWDAAAPAATGVVRIL